jgi:hypothetical protein
LPGPDGLKAGAASGKATDRKNKTTTMVLRERAQPRETFIHVKGDFTRPGPLVQPQVPAVFPPLNQPRPTRLDLARWLVQPDHPLTARVMANRIWQQYFGRGIVQTENDFGTQGIPPTHPLLLDWLAAEFMSAHWSLKHVHHLIVTSSTYRQSSRHRPELEEIDPRNLWLARQNRLRLDAEIIRDVGLTASGLLNPKIGGPSVFPPQPEGVMNLGQSRRPWKASLEDDRYRRGLYTFFWRATPHPALSVFDAPDAFSACTRRIRSNTPLQALTLLNDRQFYEFAQALADRIRQAEPASVPAKVEFGFRLCLSRPPTPGERNRLVQLWEEETREGAPSPWLSVARVLLNLDETITRE